MHSCIQGMPGAVPMSSSLQLKQKRLHGTCTRALGISSVQQVSGQGPQVGDSTVHAGGPMYATSNVLPFFNVLHVQVQPPTSLSLPRWAQVHWMQNSTTPMVSQ